MRNRGFTLIETLIAVALVAIMVSGLAAMQSQILAEHTRETLAGMLSAKKAQLTGAIISDSSWQTSLSLNGSASRLDCIGSSGGCAGVGGPTAFDLYDVAGRALFTSASMAGFNLDGSPCNGTGSIVATCAILFTLKWSPSCSASDVNCAHPLIQIDGVFANGNSSLSLNLNKYSFHLNRSSMAFSPCASAAPACGGQIAACLATGWACVPSTPVACSGTVTWTDSVSGYGTCQASVGPPGVQHNTVSSVLSNTAAGQTGSASFLCVPGQPNSGFIVQGSASCASTATPINGTCGTAGGRSYANAAGAMAAGLCAMGTATPSSISGGGPWNWSCVGSGAGHTDAACVATKASGATWYFGGTSSFFPVNDVRCVDTYSSLNLGDPCTDVGETCVSTCNLAINPFCWNGTTNTMSGGPTMMFYAFCNNPPAGLAQTVPDSACTGAGAPAGNVSISMSAGGGNWGIGPYTPSGSCVSGAGTCSGAGQLTCGPAVPNGGPITIDPWSCGANPPGTLITMPGCQSGIVSCGALFSGLGTCAPGYATGTSYSVVADCSGSVWQPVPSAPAADPLCGSSLSHCSAVGVRTCD